MRIKSREVYKKINKVAKMGFFRNPINMERFRVNVAFYFKKHSNITDDRELYNAYAYGHAVIKRCARMYTNSVYGLHSYNYL